MNRRTFLRGGACTAVGVMAGFGVDLGLTTQVAFARGAATDESTKARRLFEQFGASEEGKPVTVRNGTFKLAPGEALTFQCNGYCLDCDLALPSDDEPMAFRPMQRYIAPELRKLYVAIMQNVVKGVPKEIQVQQIVFALRNEASEWQGPLKEEDYSYVNSLMPNGEALLKQAHRPAGFISGTGLSLWASDPMPQEREAYSMLTSKGVAGRGLGMGGLEVRGTIVNASAQPFVFDTTQWVLESSRDVQAVALPVASRYTLISGRATNTKEPSPNEKAPNTSQPEQKSIQPDAHGFIGY
ncbi:MAG: hypothetical protein RR317_03060, partial [Bilophila sp.]